MSDEKDSGEKMDTGNAILDTASRTARVSGIGVVIGGLVAGPVGAVIGGLWGAQVGFGYSCSKHGWTSDSTGNGTCT